MDPPTKSLPVLPNKRVCRSLFTLENPKVTIAPKRGDIAAQPQNYGVNKNCKDRYTLVMLLKEFSMK